MQKCHVKINDKENKYFKNIKKEILELHIAHNEGNYFVQMRNLRLLKKIIKLHLHIAILKEKVAKIINPNGAIKNIAGIFNKEKMF